jgi:hypothetical protein
LYKHLNGSDAHTFHQKALTYREMNVEKSVLSQPLVLGLRSPTQTEPTEPQDSNTIRPNQIMRKQKDRLFDTLERINNNNKKGANLNDIWV